MPPGTPPAGSSVTSTYGLPGYASSYGLPTPDVPTPNVPTPNAPMINTPQTPARVPPTSMGSMANIPTAPAVATAARNEPQPPMVLLVADESGAQRRVAVSPTRHLSSNGLTPELLTGVWPRGACTTPVAITGDCQMSSYPSEAWCTTSKGIRTGTFCDRSGQVREAIKENRSL